VAVDTLVTFFNKLVAAQGQDLALGLVFLSSFFVVLAVGYWLFTGSAVQRRLRVISGEQPPPEASLAADEGAFSVHWLQPAMKIFLPKAEWRRSHMLTLLVRAGYRNPNAVTAFMTAKLLLAAALPLLILIAFLVTRQIAFVSIQGLVIALVLAAVVGFYLPNLFLHLRARERKLHFVEGFPDALDMLVVCVEAGLGLDAAIQRVGDEIAVAHPDLASELKLVSLELRAGKERTEALRALGERVDIEDVRALASVLIQAEHFGTGVASALREYASDMRLQRIQRAREKASKLPVKLIFPIMFFIFPALFLVFLGPGVIRVVETFSKMSSQ
jgi:tight adherence protein C